MFDNVRRVARQLAAYGTADVAVLAINFLLLPVYTRVLSTHEYGALALLLVCEGALKPVYRWGLDGSFLRLYYDYSDATQRKTLAGTVAFFLVAANGLLTAVLLAAGAPLNGVLFRTLEFLPAYQLLIVNSFIASFLFLPLSLLRAEERSALFAGLTFVRSLGTVVTRLALVVGLRLGVLGLILADLIVSVLLVVGLARTFRAMMARRFSWSMLREALHYGFPQVPHGLLSQTMAMADRFFLGLYLPLRDVGLYLIGQSMAAVLKLYPVAFEAAWMPFAFDSMRRPDAPQLFARMATYAFGVLGFATLAMVALAESLVAIMLPPAFHTSARVVPLLAVGIAIQSLTWFLATSLNVAKRTRVYPMVTAVGAAASVAGSVLLIPRFGIFGAAWATVAGQTAATVAMIYFAQRVYRIPYETTRLAKATMVGLAVYLVISSVTAGASWLTLIARVALLALFPAGLLLLRFFEPHEMAQMKQLAVSLAFARGRAGSLPGHHGVMAQRISARSQVASPARVGPLRKSARVLRHLDRYLLQMVFGFDSWHISHLREREYALDIIRVLNAWPVGDRDAAVEIGCGLGDILRRLRFRLRLGLDRDPRVLNSARLLALPQQGTDLRFEQFEFPHAALVGRYNAIIMVNWIHLIAPDPLRQAVHRFFDRHLIEGGSLLLDTVQDPAYTYNHDIRALAPPAAVVQHLGRYARQRDVWILVKPR